ncbi:glycerol-3-phosphate dehydrogenase/oxidase, partial [Patulibacter medicamentivorans]|uniref:glycerol-3-phosphate dehydrogenase/oxidase n=1 Tax=Patulibacter medicamentivorans TaxID=1097667 RepID=UPI00058F3F23
MALDLPTAPGALDHRARARQLAGLGDGRAVDLVVVGGGVTGAGVALDAATRGLRVVLLERRDLAWGTSRWSSKLVHGGLRYLASGAVDLALESARERHVLLTRTAPHLVRPLPYLIPLAHGVGRVEGAELRVGLGLGDALRAAARTPAAALPRARRVTPAEALHLAPGLADRELRGAILGWDGQLEDDARLVVAIARTAAAHGATILPGMEVRRAAPGDVEAVDCETGETLRLAPRAVINATGVWAGELDPGVRLQPSRGSHLVLDPSAFGGQLRAQVSVPVPGESGRFLLVIPRPDGTVILGLTDDPVHGPIPELPEPTEGDRRFLLQGASAAFRRPIGPEHVIGAYAGLRPLVAGDAGATADLSRRHVVHVASSGAVTITGGKLTTYRRMAQDALDRAVAEAGIEAPACRTTGVPLVGAAPRRTLSGLAAPRRLVERHGIEAPRIMALADRDPALARPVAPGSDVPLAELVWA